VSQVPLPDFDDTRRTFGHSHMTFHVGTAVAVLFLGLMPYAATPGGTVEEAGNTGLPPAVTDWAAPEMAVVETVTDYYAALTGGNIAAIESHVLDDERFVMLEGRHSNWGWPDYRDHHLAGELGDLSKVRFRLSFYRVVVDGALGYATFAYEVLPKEGPEMDFGRGFATAILNRVDDGWKLLHLHTS
jgi:ketosteroid isomerase-like protein